MLRLSSTHIALSSVRRPKHCISRVIQLEWRYTRATIHTSSAIAQQPTRAITDLDTHPSSSPSASTPPVRVQTETLEQGVDPIASSTPIDAVKDTAHVECGAGAEQNRPTGGVDVEKLKEKLRLWTEDTAIAVRERADRYTAAAAVTFAQLGRELNKVTGYEQIERLKKQVAEQEALITVARTAAREAKIAYERAVERRAQSQRDVNDLLQRKSTWSDEDVGRFTSLVRQDHLFEQEELRAKEMTEQTEDSVEREFTELMRVILNRYHEEQVWSDKIRSASTYGSLTVLGLNMFVFILAIIVVEPWKRRRLAATFERKIEEMNDTTMAAFEGNKQTVVQRLDKQEEEFRSMAELIAHTLRPPDAQAKPSFTELAEVVQEDVFGRSLRRQVQENIWAIAAAASAGTVGLVLGYLIGK